MAVTLFLARLPLLEVAAGQQEQNRRQLEIQEPLVALVEVWLTALESPQAAVLEQPIKAMLEAVNPDQIVLRLLVVAGALAPLDKMLHKGLLPIGLLAQVVMAFLRRLLVLL